MRIEFTVWGDPVAKARPIVTRHGTFTPKKTRDYEKKVRDSWQEQSGEVIPEGTPIRMILKFYFPIPKSYSKKKQAQLLGQPHIKLPDTDNCIKAIADGTQGYAFPNDSCIYSIEAEKIYDTEPRVEVTLETDENE